MDLIVFRRCEIALIHSLLQVVILLLLRDKKYSVAHLQPFMIKQKIEIQNGECPFRTAMDLISGKWTMSIVNTLMSGTLRFKQLERAVSGINTRMLVKELRLLESKGLVYRQAYATVPPTVEYSLTEKGRSLQPVIVAVQQWSSKQM